MRKGFSLVEVSIVLVILGLLVGGVLSGQSLIKAAELRAVSEEYEKYISATQTFRDKYFALPGDMTNATSFWGTSTTGCQGQGVGALDGTGGTCNGNGDGKVTWCNTGVIFDCKEVFWYWMHLAKSGLIEGNYPGYGSGPFFAVATTLVNVPRSRLSNGNWQVSNGIDIGNPYFYDHDYGNYLSISDSYGSVLNPQDAWNIDSKLDDGMPGTGKVLAVSNVAFGAMHACTTSTNSSDFAGTYAFSNSAIACHLRFAQAF